jgi:hypothetical protein
VLKNVGHIVQPSVAPHQGADGTQVYASASPHAAASGSQQPSQFLLGILIEIERARAEGMDESDKSPSTGAGLIVRLVACPQTKATSDRRLVADCDEHAAAAAAPGTAPPAADATEGLPGRGDGECDCPMLRATVIGPLQRPLAGEILSTGSIA